MLKLLQDTAASHHGELQTDLRTRPAHRSPNTFTCNLNHNNKRKHHISNQRNDKFFGDVLNFCEREKTWVME